MSHRRRNPLTDEWVLVSPQRLQRPWRGAAEAPSTEPVPSHDPTCALCPRVTRTSGVSNPDYAGVFVFDNDHPALSTSPTDADEQRSSPLSAELFRSAPEEGRCQVICFSERHDMHVPRLGPEAIAALLSAFARTTEAMRSDGYGAVQLFENRGAQMGASSPHPHGQIWAQRSVPSLLAREQHAQRAFFDAHQTCLLCALAREESSRTARVVYEDDDSIAVVPFWAVWPFETLVFPKRHAHDVPALDDKQRDGFSRALIDVWRRCDRLFDVPMPLSWGVHQQVGGAHAASFHVHAHLYPPLLRSASVRKWMVGYEMLGEAQRDLTPEAAAERLRGAGGAA